MTPGAVPQGVAPSGPQSVGSGGARATGSFLVNTANQALQATVGTGGTRVMGPGAGAPLATVDELHASQTSLGAGSSQES